MQLQTGILFDHAKFSIYIEADVTDPDRACLKAAGRRSLEALAAWQSRCPDAVVGLTLAFGSECWAGLGHAGEGSELKPFTPLGGGLAPATQRDVLIHVQALRQDVAFALAQEVWAAFDGGLTVRDETHGFRLWEDRGLDGFVDGTENPQGDEKITQVAAIAEGRPDAGGSYVLVQKYRLDLPKWAKVPVADQEAAVGRSKQSNEEFSKDVRLPRSHLGRVNLKEDGVSLKIVRRSLPWGTVTGEHGLLFIAFCARLHNIEAQLRSMFGDTDGQTDLLLEHMSTAVSGAYYFAPSVERLRDL